MQLTGQTVSHKTFGNGVVTGQEDHSITVSFPQGEKRFIYPDAFKSFLTMRDDTAEEKVQDLLVARKEARTEKLQALLEEQERQQRIHNFKISVNSQVAFALESQYGVMTRCGLHCAPSAHKSLHTFPQGTVRFTPGYSTTLEEIDYALKAVQKVLLEIRPQ